MRRGIVVSLAAGLVLTSPVAAQQTFYRDNKITVLVGGTAGGGFDIFSRTMANHLGRFIPGSPSIIVQDMPGGGGIVVTNHIYNTAPKDGTVIAYVGPMAVQPLLSPGDSKIRFDSEKITWIVLRRFGIGVVLMPRRMSHISRLTSSFSNDDWVVTHR